jgi:dihydroneopterin aldolase
MNLVTIRIKNASFYAYHGAVTDEQNLGGKFEVDVDIQCHFDDAIAHDSLQRTVDYEAVYAFLQDTVTAKKYYLIETLADAIARGLLKKFDAIEQVKVTVRKPHPPVKGVVDCVEAEITKPKAK